MSLSDLVLLSGAIVNIQVGVTTKDASGGNVPSWTTVLAKQPALIRPVSAKLATQYAQRQIDVSFSVLFATNIGAQISGGITTNHRIIVASSTDGTTGLIYKVEGFDPAPLLLSQQPSFRCDCSLWQSPT
jgi:head-tail adaptor